MDLQWSKDEQAFQKEVRDFLEQKLTPELRRAGRLMTSVYADHEAGMAWQANLHKRGWGGPRLGRSISWPAMRASRRPTPSPARRRWPVPLRCRRWGFGWWRTRSSG